MLNILRQPSGQITPVRSSQIYGYRPEDRTVLLNIFGTNNPADLRNASHCQAPSITDMTGGAQRLIIYTEHLFTLFL